MFGAHWPPVAALAPAFGMISKVLLSRATFDHRHHHAGMHGADQHVDLVALHELVGVVGGLGRLGLVVDGEALDLAPAELAAVFLDRQIEAVA